jgi:hypothetical protein
MHHAASLWAGAASQPMSLDVVELRDFYARPLGVAVRRLLAHRIRTRWRRISGETLIGLGFAAPYLGAFRGEASRMAR